MARKPYSARSLISFAEFGVSPRTRTRLRNSYANITPEEVDAVLRANGGGRTEALGRKNIADIREYLNGYSLARYAYAAERRASGSQSHEFRASTARPVLDGREVAGEIPDVVHAEYGMFATLSDMDFTSESIYFALKAWVLSDQTDLIWIPLADGDKWEFYSSV